MEISAQDFLLLAPEILLAGAGLVLLVVGSVGRGTGNRESAALALLALALCAGFVVWVQGGLEPGGRL
ncbi:MAG TPA: hypothetical protein VGB99_04245, partial [Acidobacteriota bacterium]